MTAIRNTGAVTSCIWMWPMGRFRFSAVLTAASLHDSQVAIPLATMTANASRRCTMSWTRPTTPTRSLRIQKSESCSHHQAGERVFSSKSIITEPKLPRQFTWAEEERFKERTLIERVNGRLNDEFGARNIYVRGAQKLMAHLMFSVLAQMVDQLLRPRQ